jgi:hypothetical protein
MKICLDINNISNQFETEAIGQKIILLAQKAIDEIEFAHWLREECG